MKGATSISARARWRGANSGISPDAEPAVTDRSELAVDADCAAAGDGTTFPAWSSCDARAQVEVEVGTPPAANGPRQFKWISATMWEQGRVCSSCGSAVPEGCAAGCQAGVPPAHATIGAGVGSGAGRVPREFGKALSAEEWGALTLGTPLRAVRGATVGARTLSRNRSSTDEGGTIARFRLGQAMAAMKIRRASPGTTPGCRVAAAVPDTPVTPGSDTSAMTVSVKARAAYDRGESTGSGWDTQTSGADTPGSVDTEGKSLANTLSFHTFNALLGYSHTDVSPVSGTASCRGCDVPSGVCGGDFVFSPVASGIVTPGAAYMSHHLSPARAERRAPRPTHPRRLDSVEEPRSAHVSNRSCGEVVVR